MDTDKPQVTRSSLFSMQVCVPKSYSDEQAREFAERENPCGTEHGWQIRRQGSESLSGCDERTQCVERHDYVHIMLDA